MTEPPPLTQGDWIQSMESIVVQNSVKSDSQYVPPKTNLHCVQTALC
jgi:hypothetical protein